MKRISLEMKSKDSMNKFRLRVYELLEPAAPSDYWSRFIDLFLIVLIVGNAVAFAIDSIETVDEKWNQIINIFTIFSGVVFTIEYILRIWSSVEVLHGKQMPAWNKRLKSALHPLQIIDLIVIATFWFAALIPYDLRVLRVVRLALFFRMARHSPALQTLAAVLRAEWRSLTSALTIMFSLVLVAATGIYFIERDIQPEVFGNVPKASWWAIATLTTVGYGDVVPITPLGKVFGGLIMIFGLGAFALPIGIIATGFAQQSSQRDFVEIWRRITRIPLFARLNNKYLQLIADLLVVEKLNADTKIIENGEELDRLIIVKEGELLVESSHGKHLIGKGSFFGELALVENRIAKVRVVSHTDCQLLCLKRSDFSSLMNRKDDFNIAINTMVELRRTKWEDVIDYSETEGT